jgi:hypothetical protein
VPEVLRSGDHARIARWRRAQALHRTLTARPDLIEARGGLTDDDRALLEEFPPSRILDRPPDPTREHAMKSTDLVDQASLRTDIPDFGPGDEVKVHVRVVEGNKERVQVFQGNVIARQGSGIARDLHRPQDQLRRRRRAHVPRARPHGRQARGRQARRRPPGEAVLPA